LIGINRSEHGRPAGLRTTLLVCLAASLSMIQTNLLLGTAIYDATIAGGSTKYAYDRPRPFAADSRVKLYAPKPGSPSYPCEYSIAAGVAATIISHFYPYLADSVNRMAQQQMQSRIAAGLAFPDDTREGFELGKKIAEKEIEYTKIGEQNRRTERCQDLILER
jgi:hypothetical protein